MVSRPALIAVALLGAGGDAAALDDSGVRRIPAPAWVDAPELDGAGEFSPENPGRGSEVYLLSDVQYHAEEGVHYQAVRLRILTETGVEQNSQLSFNFQPEYETLQLHHLRIERDGKVEDRLAAAEIEVMRREEGLEYRLYDGTLTALIILNDVRPGDVLSYAFSLKGENPVFAGRRHGFLKLGYGTEIAELRRRVLWNPEKRQMQWKVHGPPCDPTTKELPGGLRELAVERRPSSRLRVEGGTPLWRFDYPWLEYSDYPGWGAFGEWGRTLYDAEDDPLPEELRRVCERVRRENESEEERILATFNWVKRNVRYLGSFMGEHTHEPYPIAEVLARRFGDCKDKAMMTTAMLSHLGFDAAPAVVNTARQRAVGDYLPGHAGFDHLIVHLRWRGEDHWLDPTYTYQRGPLDELHVPDYGYAYVFRSGEEGLKKLEPRGFETTRTAIEERFDVLEVGGAAELEVETVATGADANSMRQQFASQSLQEVEENYRKFYEAQYPGIEVAAPLEVDDDQETNEIVIREHYRIAEFWEPMEDTPEGVQFFLQARFLGDRAPQPSKQSREEALQISHPNRVRHVIDVDLPEEWDVATGDTEIERPAFRYWSTVKPRSRGLRLVYEYESRASTVPAANFEDFQSATEELQDDLHYQIMHHGEETPAWEPALEEFLSGAGLLLFGVGVLGVFAGSGLAILCWFWDPPVRQAEPGAKRGLVGWLIIVAIGVVLQPIVQVLIGFGHLVQLADAASLMESGEGVLAWRSYYVVCVFVNGFSFPLSVLMLVLFFAKRTSFPWVFLAFHVFFLAFALAETALASGLPDPEKVWYDGPEMVLQQLVYIAIWGSYVMVSQRVKATFLRRRKTIAPPPLPAGVAQAPGL